MNTKQALIAIGVITLSLVVTGLAEGYLVEFGVVNPVYGGMTIPFVSAAIIFVVLHLMKKQANLDVV